MTFPRSPYDQEDNVFYFPRMLSKIRLHLSGDLGDDYEPFRGKGLDGKCCGFLDVDYNDVIQQVKNGCSDAEVLAWCLENGRSPTEQDTEMYNGYISKLGWRDKGSDMLAEMVKKAEFKEDIPTFFDFIDTDEGRK